MPPATRDVQRAELHKTIWRIANDLRGSVDGWDFKSYVLGTLFYRFVSENLAAYINDQEREAGNRNFDYSKLTDKDAEHGRTETVAEKGFYILPSELFVNVRSIVGQRLPGSRRPARRWSATTRSGISRCPRPRRSSTELGCRR